MRQDKTALPERNEDFSVLVFHVREGRSKAMEAARIEALAVLEGAGVAGEVMKGGPFASQGGIFWVKLPNQDDGLSAIAFDRLGYCNAVDLVVNIDNSQFRENNPGMTVWKGKPVKLERVYELDAHSSRERDPDQRRFLLAAANGEVREIYGYRGDGSKTGRRALPVCDAQLLVNLVKGETGIALLDPFGGAGGIVQEAVRVGAAVHSVDIDPTLKPGLEMLGSKHVVGSAAQLPFEHDSFDAVATEPPFDQDTKELIVAAFDEIFRVVKVGGRIAIYCAEWQAEPFRSQARFLPLKPLIDMPIDRKGYPCHILGWEKQDW